MKIKTKINVRLSKVLRRDGSFLLEAMIGTAILSIVLVFFATVSVSAFLLMQRAYRETQIAEEVFLKVESRRYSELSSEMSGTKIASGGVGGVSFVFGDLDDSDSVTYVSAGGEEGTLDSSDISLFSKGVFAKDLYAFRYQGTREDYSAVFYILKGEK